MKKNDRFEMDMKKVVEGVLGNIVPIILCGIFLALAAMVVTKLFLPSRYESTTKMYVLAKQEAGTVTNGDMEASTALTKDYREIIRSRMVIEKVIAELNLDLEYEDFLKKLTVVTPTDTRVIYITMEDEDPYLAAKAADAVRVASAEHIQQVMNTESVNVVEAANIPSAPEGPSALKNGLLAAVIGIFLSLAVVVMRIMTNDTIKETADVEKYLDISVLGVLPVVNKKGKGRKKART